LALLGPAPLSACAMWMQLPGGCAGPAPSETAAEPQAASHCEHMSLPAPAPDESVGASSDLSCCVAKDVPLPAQPKQTAPEISADSTGVAHVDVAPAIASRAVETFSNIEHSPPDLQPLLCVFLI
jgi:hypothetical protein